MAKTTAHRLQHLVLSQTARFAREERGTVTIFSLMMFILMVAIGGVAIDVMRYETQRVQLQYTLDRAVLAAAALNQTLDPRDVVMDYFATSGLQRYRIDVDVEEGVSFRTVSATAEMDINTVFMDMFGIRALTSPAFGQAEERIQNVEISMILDVSGSMGWSSASGGTKLAALQTAANDFITAVAGSNDYVNDDMLVSISVVPYNGFVNAGSTMDNYFPIANNHSASNCTRFRDGQFATTTLGATEEIARLSHFDYRNRYRNSYFRSGYCPTTNLNAILPWSSSVADLQSMVNGFTATGWTAIDQGMRWGVTLLDPSSRDEMTAMRLAGSVHEDFAGRPVDFDDHETLKIAILMTDGENTEQWDVSDRFRTGPSTIYYHSDHDRWSMYVPELDLYWIPNPRSNDSTTFNNPYGSYEATPYRGAESENLSWEWMWANFTEYAIARNFYYYASYWEGEWDYYNDLRYDGLTLFSGNEVGGQEHIHADANLRSICDAANDAGIIIFSIAFEAPMRGQDVMQHCASTDAHYYEVEGIEISEAFASIANTINTLRLTQ